MSVSKAFERMIADFVEDTARECITFDLTPTKHLTLWDSKVGGIPYLPHDVAPLKDDAGQPLTLLAQINCAELPENNIYPTKGLLQFWIGRDELYGLNTKGGSQVVYYAEYDLTVTEEEINAKYLPLSEKDASPLGGRQYRLDNLEVEWQGMSTDDYRFHDAFVAHYNAAFPDHPIKEMLDLKSDEDDYVCEYLYACGNRLGGYPTFTQDDPRDESPQYEDDDFLLLQLDSDDNVMWGDVGVTNFFVTQQQLNDLDFSQVLYNWDCC